MGLNNNKEEKTELAHSFLQKLISIPPLLHFFLLPSITQVEVLPSDATDPENRNKFGRASDGGMRKRR